MVDLHGQYLKIKDQVDFAIQRVIDSTAFIRGDDVGTFQDELCTYLDINHSITCGNGTDALQLALMALELKPGDEVITTPFTFVATVEVIRLLGLKPVFVDVRPDTFNLDPEMLEAAVTERTRAMIPVHLFGQCADMEQIMEFARIFGLYVIEDTAQALGTDFLFSDGLIKKAGTIGHMGCTSFFPTKNLGAFGDGGALFTNDASFGKRIASLVNHGMNVRYHYEHVGVNSRLDTLQAAILRIKLQHLDAYHRRRQDAARWYDMNLTGLQDLQVPTRSSFSTHIFHQYTVLVPSDIRDDLKQYLHQKGVPSQVYYPLPLHQQRAYRDLGYRDGDFPVSEDLCQRVISLPMHTELEQDQLVYISEQVHQFFNT